MVTKEEGMARRDRWADALESGEYKQGDEWLCHEGKYCCLGVACEIFETEASLLRSSGATAVAWDGQAGLAPSSLVEFLGLYSDSGMHIVHGSLASLNDEGTPFAEIARLLREHPEDWFTWAQEGSEQ